MSTTTHRAAGLAYDLEGAGTPVVFLHGLTFDRRTWRPIVDRLGGSVCSITVDLPAHGESGGVPAPLGQVATQLGALMTSLEVGRPIVVGHSMSAGIAVMHAAAHPTRGVVLVDSGPEIRPFAELLHRLAPVLRGPGFATAWPSFESSLGLERIPEPVRSDVLQTHEVRQDVVLGYWDQLMSTDPGDFQAFVDARLAELDVPCLAVFGRRMTDGERERLERLRDFQSEEWLGDGHFVHLVDADRFAGRLRQFVEHCTGRGPAM